MAFVGAFEEVQQRGVHDAADWVADEFHPDWAFARALRHGIGLHHGRIPRSLAQYCVRAFNDGELRCLVCTSTLIEGVNTKAKNVIVYDNRIARQKLDVFTFNNIRGRSGRMFEHFVGHVYLFNDPPQEDLPFVDVPVFTQSDGVPTSLLVQLEDDDLTAVSRQRVHHIKEQDQLGLDVIRANSGIDPDAQIELARRLAAMGSVEHASVAWSGFHPSYQQLVAVCTLIWEYFVRTPGHVSGVSSGAQLAFRVSRYLRRRRVRELVVDELATQPEPDADAAVETVLELVRAWVTFALPRYLMALDRIQRHVFESQRRRYGDYTAFAARLENQGVPAGIAALDEYGIPIQVATKLADQLDRAENLDDALERLRALTGDSLRGLGAFERALVTDAIGAL